MMTSFAIYRLPRQEMCTCVIQKEGEVAEVPSCSSLSDKQGFVFAPFDISTANPILLIRPDEVLRIHPDALNSGDYNCSLLNGNFSQKLSDPRMRYGFDFRSFFAHLMDGQFQKIVLSRRADEPAEVKDPITLFQHACRLYPRMFVSLVSTPQGGTWLMATPEILLEKRDQQWITIALAGTMALKGEQLHFEHRGDEEAVGIRWSQKNLQEQRYVATYITECLEQYSTQIHEDGPYTVRAADLVHLRSDFVFTLQSPSQIGSLLYRLFPTPAVCGLPKRETFAFIRQNERVPRRFYSGFSGPLMVEDETHLYISLRCMEIQQEGYSLYAGGGLLKDSVEQSEWEETEAKMGTMRRVIIDN